MKFRTILEPLKQQGLVNYQSKITLLGSCFAVNIGERLHNHQFDTVINPFGIVFNPWSLSRLFDDKSFEKKHFITSANKQVVSLDFHSKYNAPSSELLARKINIDFKKFDQRIRETDVLILTFGTAWAYEYLPTNQIISNCQKVSNTDFKKQLLPLAKLQSIYKRLIDNLLENNQSLKILLTVSPVRHLKDGLVENNRSKAILLLLCAHLETVFDENVIYYPSYELVADDLRDYRFFEKDLLHPNNMAVDYIYGHFQTSFMSEHSIQTASVVQKYNRLKAHKAIFPSEDTDQKRLRQLAKMEAEIDRLKLS